MYVAIFPFGLTLPFKVAEPVVTEVVQSVIAKGFNTGIVVVVLVLVVVEVVVVVIGGLINS